LECKRKEEADWRAAQSRDAEIANRAMGCPAMSGSEKQVAWAETIRRQTLVSFTGFADKIQGSSEPALLVESAISMTIKWLMEKTESSWWIDTIGVLKSTDGLAPIFGALTGKLPAATENEILRHVILESPHCTEEVAVTLRIGELFRARVAQRTSILAKGEMRKSLDAQKPAWPQFLEDLRARFGADYSWNCKIYGGRRIFVSNTEIRLTLEQEKELVKYLADLEGWNEAVKKLPA
jgi:hypothetical protein